MGSRKGCEAAVWVHWRHTEVMTASTCAKCCLTNWEAQLEAMRLTDRRLETFTKSDFWVTLWPLKQHKTAPPPLPLHFKSCLSEKLAEAAAIRLSSRSISVTPYFFPNLPYLWPWCLRCGGAHAVAYITIPRRWRSGSNHPCVHPRLVFKAAQS